MIIRWTTAPYIWISEVARETSAEGNSFGERVRTRFGDTAYRVGQGFVNFAVGFLGALPVLIIVAVIAAAAVLVWKKVRKERKRTKMNDWQEAGADKMTKEELYGKLKEHFRKIVEREI